jgi:hypothetical protein
MLAALRSHTTTAPSGLTLQGHTTTIHATITLLPALDCLIAATAIQSLKNSSHRSRRVTRYLAERSPSTLTESSTGKSRAAPTKSITNRTSFSLSLFFMCRKLFMTCCARVCACVFCVCSAVHATGAVRCEALGS